MKESIPTLPEDIFSSRYDSSEELEENNFNSQEANPENIFVNHSKENSEQLSSKIFMLPFTLDSYELINMKTKDELQLGGEDLLIILGNLDKIKNNELLLKLVFVSKDKKATLDLKNFQSDIKSLANAETEFIGIFQNKLFIKYENENTTKEAYSSLQKSSSLFYLLYEEENSLNSSEDNSKEKNFKKFEEKKEESKSINKAENMDLNNGNKNFLFNKVNNFGENNNSVLNMSVKKNFLQNNQINKKIIEQIPKQNPINPLFFTPQIYNPFLFPINNFPKIPSFNPILTPQIQRPNPFLMQTAFALQNLIKMQQQSQTRNNINFFPNNDKKDLLNNIQNKSQVTNNNFNNNINNNINKINVNSNMNKNLSPIGNKESSTNSNSSSSSSKHSSPLINYQLKNVKNFNIETNNNIDNNKNNNNLQKNIIYNLEEIVQNKQYKEYIPKNLKEKEKEKDIKFQTNSTRDYKLKYVSRYIVQIDNEKNFPVKKLIIGDKGMTLRNILINNCIKYGEQTTKIRLRGRGSGYKEGPRNEESKDPMELCISSLNLVSFTRCSAEIEKLLKNIYYQYYIYQSRNNLEKKMNNNDNKFENSSIVMKKILKYHYVVNRYNTLAKEEKRKKKEEEMNKINKKDNNDN